MLSKSQKLQSYKEYVVEVIFLKIYMHIEHKAEVVLFSLFWGLKEISVSFVLSGILHDLYARTHLSFVIRKTKSRHLKCKSIRHCDPFLCARGWKKK